MDAGNIVGQTLDGKYKIESEIGRGGMGTVYLALHIGTERHVAVKVITQQFMKSGEFVERFKREARAAGRLRHPNVVDVTDFGITRVAGSEVAYLVMEYLDGCSLGEILEEEKQLPLEWSIDILEQVCSAIQEAHQQGIIHRDLKPDNIWLEPDRRGSYTVKVLDFGIAKLESESLNDESIEPVNDHSPRLTRPTAEINFNETQAASLPQDTAYEAKNTLASEKNTLLQNNDAALAASESATVIKPAASLMAEDNSAISFNSETKILSEENNSVPDLSQSNIADNRKNTPSASQLTRVGSVLGTPLYMSPEQCRGEKLEASSDIYSLGVIAYQMLSGNPPFTGEFSQVMEAHKYAAPPKLNGQKIPAKVRDVIYSALAKDKIFRPQSAEKFAGKLRSQAEGMWTLVSRAMVIYSENFVKLISVALIIYLPMFLMFVANTTLRLLMESGMIEENPILNGLTSVLQVMLGFFCGAFLSGIIARLVVQKMAIPMRPLKLRPAFAAARKRLRTLLGTVSFSAVFAMIGIGCLVIPGLLMWIFWALVTPVVMLEGLKGKKAFARSYQLVKRRFFTTAGLILLSLFFIAAISVFSVLLAKGLLSDVFQAPQIIRKQSTEAAAPSSSSAAASEEKADEDYDINIEPGGRINVTPKIDQNETEEQKRYRRLRGTIRESAFSMVQLPLSILIGSFFAVVLALLYIQTRLSGGESLNDLLEQFEESDIQRKRWQQKVRHRLIQSGRLTSKS